MGLCRRRKLQWVMVFLALALGLFPIASSAAPMQTRQFTILSFDQVPILNIGVGGTLSGTFTGNANAFLINWTFRGLSSGGGAATASGTGSGSWNTSSGTLSLNFTGINSWNIPGFPKPEVPKDATVQRVSSTLAVVSVHDPANNIPTIVGNLPMRIFPSFGNPFHSRFPFWIASAVGTGTTNISALPGARSRGPS